MRFPVAAVGLALAVTLLGVAYAAPTPAGDRPVADALSSFSARLAVTDPSAGAFEASVHFQVDGAGVQFRSQLDYAADVLEEGAFERSRYSLTMDGHFTETHTLVDVATGSEKLLHCQESVGGAAARVFADAKVARIADSERYSVVLAGETWLLDASSPAAITVLGRDGVTATVRQYGSFGDAGVAPLVELPNAALLACQHDGAHDTPLHDAFQQRIEADATAVDQLRSKLTLQLTTGRVGGAKCPPSAVGDGRCDAACNDANNGFDGGDCCEGQCQPGRTFPCGAAAPYACRTDARGGTVAPHERRERRVAQGQSAADIEVPAKACLFLHGKGTKCSRTAGAQDPFFAFTQAECLGNYWGDKLAPALEGLCSAVVFGHANTEDFGWEDGTLQDAYYTVAQKVVSGGGVVFGHSMANLVLAAACADNDNCDAPYFALNAPFTGSLAADWGWKYLEYVPEAIRNWIGYSRSPALQACRHSTHKQLTPAFRLSDIVRQRAAAGTPLVRGMLCGRSSWGSGGKEGMGLKVVGDASYGIGSSNDGAVGEAECLGALDEELKPIPRRGQFPSFVSINGNHADGTMRNGDFSYMFSSQKALSWLKAKVADELNR